MKGMTKFYLGFILLAVAMFALPSISFTSFAIVMAVAAGGGLLADLTLNSGNKKLLEQKHAGMSSITSKYNEQIRALNNEYEREKKTLNLHGNASTRNLKRTYSTRYETLQKQYLNERKGFI